MIPTTHADIHLALRWRWRRGYRYGVVIVFEGEVEGWMAELPNPEHWLPGALAVDLHGNSWLAVGGSDQQGAALWMPTDSAAWNSVKP